ncbi:cyclic GMP-AMP synthase DncV-like nucleotidyltransferase [Rhodococcus sp. 1168]|uniref:SMODS domain-containing nucleotidyltransferase n=1 Tax=Rhodococcus sp. 1168 TaxID=2018041 RepID=UPI000A0C37F1|nr:nucleotidyltransferase [Rhodococcus sp. 1168]ORI20692.1 nucleotidyltransferase [Rhodococcus sp. 1168]
MKHTDYFKNFLENTVNLPQPKVDLLSARVESIYNCLKANPEAKALIKKKIPQGSWPQRTIIKPVNGNAFDGDFMIQMVEEPDWADNLKKYGDTIYNVLHNTSPYKDMPHGRKCRCVYVNYAENAMHVDIVPFVLHADGTQWIINRDDNTWERTDTDGFTSWMKKQDGIANKRLREVIRIMKFLRDHKNSWTGTRSILLTTLLGERVEEWHKIVDSGYYSDLPTALLHIVSDLDAYLQQYPLKPIITDPSGSGTSFDHRWTQETYSHFRNRINVHAAEIKNAYEETDFDESVKKWQALFGDGFKAPAGSQSSAAGKFSTVASTATASSLSTVKHSGRAG